MTELIPRGAMDRACLLFSDLTGGRWEKVDGGFDASLRGNVDLAREWATVTDCAGRFEHMDTPSARQFGGYTVVDVALAFAAGGAIREVVFDRAGKVAGLALEFPYSPSASAGATPASVAARKKAGRVHGQEP
jgi:hypothetical protein